MGDLYLDARLDALRRAQNPDGGWGFFPGKQSWLEPTFYASLALHGQPEAARAWTLVKSWQNRDGSWRANADVQISSWTTALSVTLATLNGESGPSIEKAVDWLLNSSGTETAFLNRAFARAGLYDPERNLSHSGWPWKPNTSSWVEPTAHALVALKKVSAKIPSVRDRVREGESQLFDVRCKDGGWNYGSPAARGFTLPSYPETTALALVGLQGRTPNVAESLAFAGKMAREIVSPMAKAWLRIALQLHNAPAPDATGDPSPDILITALEAVSCANYKLLSTGGQA